MNNDFKLLSLSSLSSKYLSEIDEIRAKIDKEFNNFEERTKKHMREMEALVNHNRFLSTYGKKILYSNGFAGKLKSNTKDNLYC